jgi:hypothetical protein
VAAGVVSFELMRERDRERGEDRSRGFGFLEM